MVGATSVVGWWLASCYVEVCMGCRRFKRLPVEMRRRVVEEARKGKSQRQISRATSVSLGSVKRVLGPLGGVVGGHRRPAWW